MKALKKKYNYLTILEIYQERDRTQNRTKAKCQCKCGNIIHAQLTDVKRGCTKSCGCLQLKLLKTYRTTHGHTKNGKKTPTYSSWEHLKNRCDENKVSKRWLKSFSNFLEDMGKKPKNKVLRRINEKKNYTKANCHWVKLK